MYYKRVWTARWKRFVRQGMGKGCGVSMPSPGIPFSPHLQVFTSSEALQTLSFGGFLETSFHRHHWLSHWPSVTDSTSSPSPLPEGEGVGPKGSASNHVVSSSGNQLPPLGGSKSHLINIKKNLHPSHLGNCKDFRSSVSEMDEDQVYI